MKIFGIIFHFIGLISLIFSIIEGKIHGLFMCIIFCLLGILILKWDKTSKKNLVLDYPLFILKKLFKRENFFLFLYGVFAIVLFYLIIKSLW